MGSFIRRRRHRLQLLLLPSLLCTYELLFPFYSRACGHFFCDDEISSKFFSSSVQKYIYLGMHIFYFPVLRIVHAGINTHNTNMTCFLSFSSLKLFNSSNNLLSSLVRRTHAHWSPFLFIPFFP